MDSLLMMTNSGRSSWLVLRGLVVLLATAILLESSAAAQTSRVTSGTARRIEIGNIKDESAVGGCGCELTFSSERKKKNPKFVFFSGMDEKTAWMNINGRDVELKLKRASSAKGKERVGNRSTEIYVRGDLKVSIVRVVTRVCKPREEDCESTDYNATVTVTDGSRKKVLKLKGSCGC